MSDQPTGAKRYGTGGGDAYYDAVRFGGYTGTREQFGKDQAEFAGNASAVAQAKETVLAAEQHVVQIEETFTNETVPAATESIENKGTEQVQLVDEKGDEAAQAIVVVGNEQTERVTHEGDTQVARVQEAKVAAVEDVEQAGETQVGNVNTAGTTNVEAVRAAGTTQVEAVNSAGSIQVQAIEDKGDEVLASIPADYTELTGDVDNLKSAFLLQTHPGDNVVVDLVFTQGGYYNSTDNDTYVVNANWGYTDKIAITAGKTYFVNTPTNQYISFYDSNGDFISGLAGVSATAPATAAYIRLSASKARQAIVKLTVDTPYTDYVSELQSVLESQQPNIVRTLETLSIPNGDNAEHLMTISDFDQTYENFVEITNMGREDAWYGVTVLWNGNPTMFTFYQVISPGETKTYEIPVRQNIRTRTIKCQSPGSVAGKFVLKRIESPYIESLKAQGIWVCDAAASGLGIYQSIENAVKWMKKSSFYTGKTKQCVVYIRNGSYTIDPTLATADTFWSVILTAQHDVAFVGESRDQTIIQMTCPSGTAARIFDISGNSRLAHLTIKNIAGSDYTASGSAGHNPYAVHIDSQNSKSEYQKTVVEDCYIYSSMFTPIGAGLWNKQTQVYRNCVFEFGSQYSGFQSWGALYIHGPSQSSATECALEIDNCTMISTNGQKALALPDVAGSLQYTDIPVTIQRCIGYSSNPNNLTDVSASRVALTPQSALNNVERWNA